MKSHILASFVWFSACAGGLILLATYQFTPGLPALRQPIEIETSTVRLPADGYRLVVAIHPQCPCSEATISEMLEILSRCPNLKAQVLMFTPANAGIDWTRSKLWQQASALPHVTVLTDTNGLLAQKLGAKTSGQAFLFDNTGKVVFKGGLTQGRGHVGFNRGAEEIAAITDHLKTSANPTNVYGCALFNQASSDEFAFSVKR